MKKNIDKDLIRKLNFEDVLLDSLPNPVYYKDEKGKYIRCNRAFANLIQREKSEIIGKVAYLFFSKKTSDRHKLIDEQIMKNLGTNEDKIVYKAPDGNIKYLKLTKAVYLKENGQVGGIVCVMNDITQTIKENEFLIQRGKLAEMGEMLASIAHQWSEPLIELSALVQKMELLYSLKKLKNDDIKGFVNSSMKQIKYMSDTLNDFRDFLKPSTKKEYFDIRKSFNEILEIVERQIYYFHIDLSCSYYPKDEKILIYGYENEFKQVLLNLINNAKNKLAKIDKKENFQAKIIIEVTRHEDSANITIKDNGGNINDEIKDKIFDPFFTTNEDGTGFGLYIAKLIIEDKMSGKIDVENQKDYVSFCIDVPIKESR